MDEVDEADKQYRKEAHDAIHDWVKSRLLKSGFTEEDAEREAESAAIVETAMIEQIYAAVAQDPEGEILKSTQPSSPERN